MRSESKVAEQNGDEHEFRERGIDGNMSLLVDAGLTYTAGT